MDIFNSSDLKAILHSKRANVFYLEKCRVMQKDGRVVYLAEDKKTNNYWNIPIANTTVILLGIGTSITQAAVRMLASAGVLIGFSGNGGTPLIAGNEIEWLTPQSEYRPTEYMQGWMGFWFDDGKRLTVAKRFQLNRLECLKKVWEKDKDLKADNFIYSELSEELENVYSKIQAAETVEKLLSVEAHLAKGLYKFAAYVTGYGSFSRKHDAKDDANRFLNHGNYLAYGLAATTLWVLGIPHGFAVMHGKTRRGALVFDVADLVKDAVILPLSFIAAKKGLNEQEFRTECLNKFTDHKLLEFMFDSVKQVALEEY